MSKLVIIFSADGEKAKKAASKYREEGHTANLRDPRVYRSGDVETAATVVLLDGDCSRVKADYEAWNTKRVAGGLPAVEIIEPKKASGGSGGGSGDPKDEFDAMNGDALKKYAADNEIEVPMDVTKVGDLRKFLRSKKAEKDNAGGGSDT